MESPLFGKVNLKITRFYYCVSKHIFDEENHTPLPPYNIYRRKRIIKMLKELTQTFAMKICAFAVMDEHTQMVIYVDENQAKRWNEEAVLTRWESLFPKETKAFAQLTPEQQQVKLKLWRSRLKNPKWYLRCLVDKISEQVMFEPYDIGRFMLHPFFCSGLCSDGEIAQGMVQADLTPMRDNDVASLEASDFTSIQERIHYLDEQMKLVPRVRHSDLAEQPKDLMELQLYQGPRTKKPKINFNLNEYTQLLEYAIKMIRSNPHQEEENPSEHAYE